MLLAEFQQYVKEVQAGWVPGYVVLFSPVDDVHGALLHWLKGCTKSVTLAMYGFDDQECADEIEALCLNTAITVTLTFDASQSSGVHEKLILNKEKYPNTTIAIGNSEKNAIMHLKSGVVDGQFVIHGSTNWSGSGETLQDNELIVFDSAILAKTTTNRIIRVHANMLAKQPQPKTAADLAKLRAAAPTT